MAKTDKHEEAYTALMKGLNELDLRESSDPCDLVLIGDHSFPLVMNSQGQVVMAASFYGRGRIVVLAHEAYLTSYPEVVENALNWLKGHDSDVCIAVHRKVKAVADNLSQSSFQAEVVGGFDDKMGASVYVTDAYSVGADAKELVAFMKKGGGVLIAGQAWYWASQHKTDNTLHQFDGNKVAGVAGIYFSDHHAEKETLPIYPQIPSSWMAVVLGKDFEDDLRFLLQGISEFKLPNDMTASEILVHGPLAFPIGVTDDQETFLAGGYYGQGRVILASHENLLLQEDLAPFWKNALLWLDEGRGGVVGLMGNRGRSVMSKSGLKCARSEFKPDLSVFVCTSNVTNHEEILEFVAEGGGLLIGGQAWRWAKTHKKHHVLRDFSGNQVLNKMGLSLLGSTLRGSTFKAPVPSRDFKNVYHFRHYLHRFACHVNKNEHLTKFEQDCLKRLGHDCNTYLEMRALDCPSYLQVVSMLTETLQRSGMPQVCDTCPIKTPRDHLLLLIGTELYNVSPNPEKLLPCLIKDNPVLQVVYNHKVKVDVDTSAPEWFSTGLYLSPGMKTFVAFPPEMVNKKWKIQIGCQTDRLKSKVLRRPARVHEILPVTSEMMHVSNLWGGLIYLVAAKDTKLKNKEVVVQMAVAAPYYKSGETTAEEWDVLRTAPAPWAELEFENIILTVPSGSIRKLDNIEELADQWNRIMRAIADLSVMPHKFPRKERFVVDVQISHGFMHAGYPIMAQRTVARELVSTDHAKKKGLWGAIHELGHNRQKRCCEFPPHTTEATCNLWAVYVHEKVLGLEWEQAHKGIAQKGRDKRLGDYVKCGKNLSKWTMWTALETYLQLQEKFGWEAFKKVFDAYGKMKSHPKIKNVKMNLYAETFSQAVGMDLTGFFKAWGWPIDAATEKKLSSLPPWDDHPMKKFD